MSIMLRVMSYVTLAFVLTATAIEALTVWQMRNVNDQLVGMVETLTTQVNTEKIDKIMSRVQTTYHDLVDSGMEEAYREDAQAELLATLSEELFTLKEGEQAVDKSELVYPFIVERSGRVLLAPYLQPEIDPETGEAKEVKEVILDQGLVSQIQEHAEFGFDYSLHDVERWGLSRDFEPWGWSIGYSMPREVKYAKSTEVAGVLSRFENRQMVIIVLSAVLSVVALGFLVNRQITRQIKQLAVQQDALAHDGDLEIEVNRKLLRRKDEIGELARSTEAIVESFREVGQAAQQFAQGNWDVPIRIKSEKDSMNRHLLDMVEQVNDMLLQVREAVIEVAEGANHVTDASTAMSQGATEQAASLEEISSSLIEFQQQVKDNACNCRTVNENMNHMTMAMQEITQSSRDIEKIIKIIDEIAFQTNLLALNAAVEAAHAGRQGAGFAVVAEEVRNLAANTAEAAKETTQMIEKSITKIETGNQYIEDISQRISQTVKTTDEQEAGIQQINLGLGQVDIVTQNNANHATQNATSAEKMSTEADLLQQRIMQFRLKDVPHQQQETKEPEPQMV